MRTNIILLTVLILIGQTDYLFGFSLIRDDERIEVSKRWDNSFLPTENFSLVTSEKLLALKQLADSMDDPKLYNLYRLVNYYVQMARRSHEHLLWRYDVNQGGLILSLRHNLDGILYYG